MRKTLIVLMALAGVSFAGTYGGANFQDISSKQS